VRSARLEALSGGHHAPPAAEFRTVSVVCGGSARTGSSSDRERGQSDCPLRDSQTVRVCFAAWCGRALKACAASTPHRSSDRT
jgi:hypothetical protein